MKNKSPVLRRLYEYGVITLGCAIYALSFNWFFQPNNISMGGFTGIAQIINHFLPVLPIGVTSIVMNRNGKTPIQGPAFGSAENLRPGCLAAGKIVFHTF